MRAARQGFLKYPLSTLLSGPANVRVLRELSVMGSELSPAEVVDRTRLTKPSVLASLNHMVELGFVEAVGPARQRIYRLDKKHPLSTALVGLFEAEQRRFGKIMKLVVRAATEAGVLALWVYGSVPGGDDGPGSDLDIALVAQKNIARVKEKVRNQLRDEEDRSRFSASVVALDVKDVVRLAKDRNPFWLSLVNEPHLVPLIGPSPQALLSKLQKERSAA